MANKALLLGVNEYKNFNSLKGCAKDVEDVRSLLVDLLAFDAKNVKTLVDDRVTKSEVQKSMKWLFRDTKPGDHVVFHFSGHGSYTADLDGDEDDGADEMICLPDMDFNDPETFLIDDELRRWSQTKPDGVELTIILDSCHSGTGTRLLLAPESGEAVRVDVAATLKRSLAPGAAGGRGLAGMEAAVAALDPGHEAVVRARFLDPPQAVKDEVERLRRSGRRSLVTAELNHVLLAACRDDQTAADATIDDQPHGAFTFYLCRALRQRGVGIDRRDLIQAVQQALHSAQFSQDPQLEGKEGSGPLFRAATAGAGGAPTAPGPVDVPNDTRGAVLDILDRLTAGGGSLPPDLTRQVLDLLTQLVGTSATAPAREPRGLSGRHLVYVHGICRHERGFSNGWWDALHPFTSAFGAGTLDGTRHEVLWSDLVNDRGVRAATPRDTGDRAEFAARVRGALEDRAAAHAMKAGPSVTSPDLARELIADQWLSRDPRLRGVDERGFGLPNLGGLSIPGLGGLSIPGINCVDDFTAYMFDDGVRQQIIDRFTQVVRPLLDAGAEIDLVSHSWGTVVAYEGLRELEGRVSGGAQQVHTFYTVGAALSIFPVKLRLRPANRDGRRPAMVARWVNLNAQGDPVGGHLQGNPYQVDAEFLDLSNLGCGFLDASCAHGSYFRPENAVVNRDIFAAFINRA